MFEVAAETRAATYYYERSRTRRTFREWLQRLFIADPLKLDIERRRILREIRAAAVEAVDAALSAFTRVNAADRRPGRTLQ